MYWYGDHMSGWGWALMTISTVAIWALIVTGVVVLIRNVSRIGRQPEPAASGHTAEQLLAERFARGQIDETEYRSRLDTLRGHTQPPGSSAVPTRMTA
jgi:putative membrane protein